MSEPCKCYTCQFTRRHREIKLAPSFEAYESLVDDFFTLYLNEELDSSMKIHRLEEELKALKEKQSQP